MKTKLLKALTVVAAVSSVVTVTPALAAADPYSLGYGDDCGNGIGEGWGDTSGYHYSDGTFVSNESLNGGTSSWTESYDDSWNTSYSYSYTPSVSTIGGMGTLVFANGSQFPLYYSSGWDIPYAQSISDQGSAAAWVDYDGIIDIADHASQGFSVIKNYGVGSIAYIVHDGWTDTIQCVGYYANCDTGRYHLTLPDGRNAITIGKK